MRILRVYRDTSLKHGKEEEVDEAKVREIANQAETRCEGVQVGYSDNADEVIRLLKRGKTIETYFSTFKMVGQQALIS